MPSVGTENTRATALNDKQSLDALVAKLREPFLTEYKAFKNLALESAFPGRKFVVYTMRGGVPTDIEIISTGEFRCDYESGPSTRLEDSRGYTDITTIPRRLSHREVYFHIPQNFTLKYTGRRVDENRVDFVSHYALLIKTRSSEDYSQEGFQHCVTLNRFRERHPSVRIRY